MTSATQAADALLDLIAAGRALNFTRAQMVAALAEQMDAQQLATVCSVLDNVHVQLAGKALALARDGRDAVVDTRVLHQIDPVLDDDDSGGIMVRAATVGHTLRVTYAQAGQLREARFTMMVDDIEKLRVQLGRALQVDAKLRGLTEEKP